MPDKINRNHKERRLPFSISIEYSLGKKFRAICSVRNLKASGLIRDFVLQWMKENDKGEYLKT
ncbi:MAG: hypothetical protein AABY22_04550 [Nanoarchaeota archaeon]|mgnify:CR=1 FL=1